jgi:hypothetical protein
MNKDMFEDMKIEINPLPNKDNDELSDDNKMDFDRGDLYVEKDLSKLDPVEKDSNNE